MKTVECYKFTSDNWCPNFIINNDKNYVKIKFILSENDNMPDLFYKYKIFCSGNDDIFLEKEYLEYTEFIDDCKKIILMDDITFNKLENIGFIN